MCYLNSGEGGSSILCSVTEKGQSYQIRFRDGTGLRRKPTVQSLWLHRKVKKGIFETLPGSFRNQVCMLTILAAFKQYT